MFSAVAVQGAEPPSSTANEASGREGRSARLRSLSPRGDLFLPLEPSVDLLPSPHTSGSVDAASKPASVVRGRTVSHPTLGNDDREHMPLASVSPSWGRAREHRELNRRDNPRHRSRKRGSQHCSDPPPPPWNAKRKPGRVHVVRKALAPFVMTRELRSLEPHGVAGHNVVSVKPRPQGVTEGRKARGSE